MRSITTELKVGLLIVAGLTIIVMASIVVTGWRPGQGGTYTLFVTFENVAGLLANSPVQEAGVKIGTVQGISLEGGKARLSLAIQTRYQLHTDARAVIRSLGILGDKYVEVNPGTSSQPLLVNGDTIQIVATGGDLDTLVTNLGDILNDVRSVTKALSATLGGEPGQQRLENIMTQIAETTQNLSRITDATNKQLDVILGNISGFTGSLDRITTNNEKDIRESLANLNALTRELKDLAVQNRAALDGIIANLDTFSKSLAEDGPAITKNLKDLLVDNREALNNTIANLDESFKKVDKTMGNLESVTDKMDKGQGTIGKLLNDETTVDQINQALFVVNRYLTDLDRIKLDVGVETDYLSNQDLFKTYVSVYIQPLKDRYYLIQLVDNPRGTSHVTTTTTQTVGGGTVVSKETKVTDELEFSLLLAQRYYDTVLMGGLIESKAGVGIDQYFGKLDQFRLGLDVWDFSNPLGPHVKVAGYYRIYSNAYVVLGGDDLISKNTQYQDAFFGIGIRFNEDSLKPLASSLPLSSVR